MSSFGLCFGRRSMKRLNRSRPTSIAGWSSTIPSVPIKAIATWADARSRLSCNTWKVFAKKVKNTLQPGPADVGWRYCHRTTPLLGLSSPPWRFHESLAEYFTDAVLDPGSSLPNSVISSADKGSQVVFSSPITEVDRLTPNDFIGILNVSGG